MIARQRIQVVEKKLSQLKREFEKASSISASWMANMVGHLKIAKEYGIFEGDISDLSKPEDLLLTAKNILENIPDHSRTKIEDIANSNNDFSKYEAEEALLSSQIGALKKRLNDIKNLKSGFAEYGNSVRKRVDRLSISQWLETIGLESQACPACGSSDHPKANSEILSIAAAFKKYENESKSIAEVPTSFMREEERVNLELQGLLERQKEFQNRFDLLIRSNKKAQDEFQRRKNMFIFLGHLKASLETFEKLADGGEFLEEISILENELTSLRELVDEKTIKQRVDVAEKKISQGILDHLKTLDVEEKYREVAPKFSVKDLNISVLSNDGNWHFLAEIGSASNWVSFHIALMCSLQEYFLNQGTSCVPSFVIFDQPSQVYFPKLRKKINDEIDDPQYEDEDIEAVRKIFRTLAKSVLEKKGAWQCIVLDHADKGIYGDIEGVVEIDEWRGEKKLIPKEWYS